MARSGRRAARWAVALLGASACVLLAVAGGVLSPPPVGAEPSPAATPRSIAPTPTAPGPTTPQPGETGPSSVADYPIPSTPGWVTFRGSSPSAPFVSFIGDSWTEGAGATDEVGYAHLTGRRLGWTHRVLGVSGSGYLRGGSADMPYGERVLPAVAGDPDVVVVQGSINERGTPPAELAAAATAVLERLHEAAGPDTAVLVLGASYVPGVPDELIDEVNDSVRTAATRLGLPFVDVAAENWSDPADASIWADPRHVNDRGARLIADRLVPLLRRSAAG